MQSKCRKIRTKKTLNTDTFHVVFSSEITSGQKKCHVALTVLLMYILKGRTLRTTAMRIISN